MLGTRTLLGLAIDESGVIVAEVAGRSSRPDIRRVGQWAFPAPFDASEAQELGQQFKQYLRSNHFSAKQAVVGVPTKWIVAREITAPPANAEALSGMLAIQAERAFSLNASELIFDYCGQASTSESRKVMLLAARREIIDGIKEMIAAAGLQIQSITISALAFERIGSEGASGRGFGLYARPSYCEFWSQSNGRPEAIKHVPMPGVNGTLNDRAHHLSAAIQRLMVLEPQQGQASHHVTIYDASEAPEGLIDRLNERLAPAITVRDGATGLRWAGGDRTEVGEAIAAAAVALTGVGMAKPQVDFLNPRIGRKQVSSHKRLAGWGGFAAAIVLVLIGAVVFDWQRTRSEIAIYQGQLDGMSGELETAHAVVDRMAYAHSWISQRPEFLECLRQLTMAFPEAPTVWATSLALNENDEGTLIGRAVDDKSIIEVQDLVKQNEAFADVQMIHIRDVGRNSSEKEFAMKFKFQGVR